MPSTKLQQAPTPLPPLSTCERYTVTEALQRLRVCRATFYKAVAAGEIKTIKTCGRVFVAGIELARHMGHVSGAA